MQIFAGFRRFLQILAFCETQIVAENRRLSQETAENRRNPQETADWRSSPKVRPLKRGPICESADLLEPRKPENSK